MFTYYLTLGWRSLRRNPVLTMLMVLTLGVGVAASVSTTGVLLVMSGNPIPHKSDRLIVPLLDTWSDDPGEQNDDLPPQMTYSDATRLLEQRHAPRQAAIYGVGAIIESGREDLAPFTRNGLAVSPDFFPIFEIPFAAGGPWDASAAANATDVVVISQPLAQQVFGGEDSETAAIGKTIRINDRDFVVTGVIGHWEPLMRYYRLIGGGGATFGEIEDVFMPFTTAIRLEYPNEGTVNCNGFFEPGYQNFLRSECIWIQYWAELDSPADREAYGDYLQSYIAEQKTLGRFPRPAARFQLFDVMEWLDERGVVARDSRLQSWLALGFLLVCVVNTVGLLLAKFTAKAGEVGVRRAVGATRGDLFRQLLVEAGVVGIAGGLVGLVLSFGGLWLIAQQSSSLANVAKINGQMLIGAVAVAVLASLVAGLLPTWRACQVRPALQLKSQ